MPTIFSIGPFRIVIHTNDHSPAHVHCIGPDVEVLISIEAQTVLKNFGVHSSDVKRLQKFIKSNSEVLMIEWRHIHG